MRRRLLLAALLLCAACQDGADLGFGVATHLTFDQTIDDASLARISQLRVEASGDEQYVETVLFDRALQRTEAFVYRPTPGTRLLALAFEALDTDGTRLGAGRSATLTLPPAQTTTIDVVVTSAVAPLDDGGSGDAGPTDGAFMAGGPSRCDRFVASDELLDCRGFEASTDFTTPRAVLGTVSQDTTRWYRGSSSAKFTLLGGSPGSNKAAELSHPSLPLTAMYAMRAFYYLPGPPLGTGTRLLTFDRPAAPYQSISVLVAADGPLALDVAVPGAPSGRKTASISAPFNRWFCLELRVTWGDVGVGSVAVYLDDQPVADISYAGSTLISPPLNKGVWGTAVNNTASAEYVAWGDELVIASQPIGCAK